MPERPDIADWPSPRRTRPRRTCFLSSQMNAIRGFSAPLNGVRPGHFAKMSSRQKQETPRNGGCGTHIMTNVENLSPKPGRPALNEAARGGDRRGDLRSCAPVVVHYGV